jgi:hypothetical protein
MAPPNYHASHTAYSHASSHASSQQRQRQGYDVSSLGDPSLMSVTDCYTTPSPSEAEAMRRRKNKMVSAHSNAMVVSGAAKSPGVGGTAMLDLSDVKLTSRDTHQQTIIWNEMTASRRKLEEENQVLRDKLTEAQIANKVLRVKVKQHRGVVGRAAGAEAGGGMLGRHLDRGNLRAGSSGREPSTSSGLLHRVFSRRDAFRNPAAPGIKRFKVQAPRGLPLPPTTTGNKQVQHIFPLPDDHYPRMQPPYHGTTLKSSIRSTRTPPTEIVVVPAAVASSPERVPASAPSSVVSPTTSPTSNSSSSSSSSFRQQAPPQLQQRSSETRNRRYHSNQNQQQQLQQSQPQQQEQAYSLMRVVPLRRQGTTESTLTVRHSNHDGEHGTRTGSTSQGCGHRNRMHSGSSLLCSAPDMPMLVEEGEDEDMPGCQTPSSTMMMIANSELPTSILERLAGAKIGSFHDADNDGSTPSAAIVLSACNPMWYDPEAETRHYYTTHTLHHHPSARK